MRDTEIKPLANSIAAEYETRSPSRIAEQMGIDLIYHNLGSNSGYFCKIHEKKFIVISKTAPIQMRPFIIAHELGHAILHSDIGTHSFNANSFLSTCRIERQANLFAVELLLPDEIIEEFDDMGIYDIAAMVGIPEQIVGLKK